MLCKLAWGNVRRAGRDYLVYLLTLTLGVTVFYAFSTISMQVDIAGIDEEGLAQVMGSILGDLTYFLAGVMAFLMVYANNFIMKRRKKEFGLYQVLGMGRGRVATIMALETVIVSVVAFVAGIVLGVGLSQLMTFFTASLFKTQIANFHFFFSVHAFNLTLACMLVMFVLTLLLNLRAVRRTKLIELMGAERRNESIKTRNPWIAIAIFAVGVVLVGVAYYRLLRDGFPLTATDSKLQEAMNQFGITTAMVTVGTFALFWGLSGMLIKLLQSLRSVYWRGLNMFTVRQLSAKVNTVCFSMGVIAMILFLAITSVTCGMSIANVMNENLERYTPADMSQTYIYYTPETLDYYKEYVNPSEADRMVLADSTVDLYSAWHGDPWHGDRKGKSADNNDETGKKVSIADVAGEHVQIDSYLSYPLGGSDPSVTPSEMCKTMGEKLPRAFGGSNADTMGLFVTPASQYNKLRQMMGEEPVSIGLDQYLLTCDMGGDLGDLYTKYMAGGHTLTLGGHELKPATDKSDKDTAAIANSAMSSNPGTVVVADELLSQLKLQPYSSSLLVNYKQGMDTTEADESIKYTVLDNLLVDGKEPGSWGIFITRSEMYTQAAQMNGMISYLAIYIGFVLVVACAAILSIQQLSNVADGSRSYRVLAQIGCDDRQIRHSVMAQQAVFFLFPLAVGLAHSFVALKVIIELVSTFGNMSIGGTVGLTCAIFLAAYGGYFLVTYLMSTGMVQAAIATRYSE
ncbi:FtsX-like permease family protein [Collinsella sp. BIOML-A4]|uniref:ABC transporter permease n=1 Tax=unclassified Collinsella TaxID=2637548 RepID=UPI0013718A58|nr:MULTISPECIES: ABC transporter permease [unclassified Collinsella]MZJ33733.1 FtsX-like permease family protein [Collinsella sp. BIOML-A1]MZJ28027.1 FtsX-like permease family protein [Collinsella sp. BIOML-A2]MZJ28691.1 FtsX-like permease family protein [Collinsella sp. BIOML-A3]MZJ97476.1 FtsX-like permease family protein [Collinsella sp. BIOML-A6]MZK31330.1 FtsX-like permease family protein [Collinsella sp. BIOML-A5]